MSRPLIAILRGVTPGEVVGIGQALVDAGITRIEVPLNSLNAVDSVASLASTLGDAALIGAGTVLTVDEVSQIAGAGGRLIVSPNTDPAVIEATKSRGMLSFPGVYTASECFTAIGAGADGLKIFPAFQMGSKGLKALRDVLPKEVPVFAVGGVGAGDFAEWLVAGANGFGIGGALYRPGAAARDVGAKARELVEAYDAALRTTS